MTLSQQPQDTSMGGGAICVVSNVANGNKRYILVEPMETESSACMNLPSNHVKYVERRDDLAVQKFLHELRRFKAITISVTLREEALKLLKQLPQSLSCQ